MSQRKIPASKSNRHKHLESELLRDLSSGAIKVIGNYVLGGIIGEGSFGKVKEATHNLTGAKVAVKIVDKTHAPTLVREIEIWKGLRHPNIAQLFEVLNSENKIYMVMERSINGEIFDYLMNQTRLQEEEGWRLFRQLISAVDYCHSKNCVHRDLKLENMLLDENMNLKLIDFGFTRELDGPGMLLETFCGSVAYAAPEMISGQKYHGPGADIWSMGVILYTLIFGYLPFDDDNEQILQKKIVNVDYCFPEEIEISPALKDLIQGMLKGNSDERYSMEQIKNHTWITNSGSPEYLIVPYVEEGVDEELISAMSDLGFDVRSIYQNLLSKELNARTSIYHLLKKQREANCGASPFSNNNLYPLHSSIPPETPSSQISGASESPVYSRNRIHSAPFLKERGSNDTFSAQEAAQIRSVYSSGRKSWILNGEDGSSNGSRSGPITASNSPFSNNSITSSSLSAKQRSKSQKITIKNPKTIDEEEDNDGGDEDGKMASSPALGKNSTSVPKLTIISKSSTSPISSNPVIVAKAPSPKTATVPIIHGLPAKDYALKIKISTQRAGSFVGSTNSSISELDELGSQNLAIRNLNGQKMSSKASQLYNVRKTSTKPSKEITLEFVKVCHAFGIRYKKHGLKFFCHVRIVTKKNDIGRKHGVLDHLQRHDALRRRKSDSAVDQGYMASYMTFYKGIPTGPSREHSPVSLLQTNDGGATTKSILTKYPTEVHEPRKPSSHAVSICSSPLSQKGNNTPVTLKDLMTQQISPSRDAVSENVKEITHSPLSVSDASPTSTQMETATEIIRFEMHIIKIRKEAPEQLPLASTQSSEKVFGLKFRRISGEQWHYKHICDQIVGNMVI